MRDVCHYCSNMKVFFPWSRTHVHTHTHTHAERERERERERETEVSINQHCAHIIERKTIADVFDVSAPTSCDGVAMACVQLC